MLNEKLIPSSIARKDYVDNINVYSTEEKQIGKWVNGKPLYRSVISGSIPSTINGDNWHNVLSIGSEKVIRNIGGTLNGYTSICKYSSPSYFLDVRILNGNIEMIGKGYIGHEFNLILEYTKKND